MEFEKETAKKEVDYVGSRQFAILMVLMAIWLLAVFGFGQYASEQKMRTYLQCLIGCSYENDAKWTSEMLKMLFETEISAENMEAGQRALTAYGYTREGMRFLMDAQRQMSDYLPLGIFVLFLSIFFFDFAMARGKVKVHYHAIKEKYKRAGKEIKRNCLCRSSE